MEYNLIEKFILLALDNKKGRFVIDSMSLNYGIAGAILLELSELNKISVEKKKLVLLDNKLTGNFVIDECIKFINDSNRKRRVKVWVYKIGNKASSYKKAILNDLSKKQVIKIESKSYLWGLIKLNKYHILLKKPIDEIKSGLKGIVLRNEKPDLESLLLLSLLNSCKLTRVLFISKKEHKLAGRKIKGLTKEIEISDAVSETIKEIQTAIVVATTTAFIGATSN